jgi:protein phosphatase 1E
MGIDAAVRGAQGPRVSMEDRHVLETTGERVSGAVFDGHMGTQVAVYAAGAYPGMLELPPATALRRLHESSRGLPGGACAVVFRIDGDAVSVANVGDAELALVREGEVEVVTEAHRLSNPSERARLSGAGGLIEDPYVIDPRTGDGLMPTRCLGDHAFEAVGIVCEPAEWTGELRSGWLVAACDGLWDVLSPDELPAFLDGSAAEVAERLTSEALDVRGVYDNVTVIVVHKK